MRNGILLEKEIHNVRKYDCMMLHDVVDIVELNCFLSVHSTEIMMLVRIDVE